MGHFRNFWGIKGNERFSREFEPVTKGNAGWRLAGMHTGREGKMECSLCGDEYENVSHVLWECSEYSSTRACFINSYRTDISYAETIITLPCGRTSHTLRQ